MNTPTKTPIVSAQISLDNIGYILYNENTAFGGVYMSFNDITRIFYFFVIGQKIILTNGFVKKTQKTPKSEIELAKKYRNDYLNREEN